MPFSCGASTNAFLEAAGDPDSGYFLDTLASTGHRVGYKLRMPRARALYDRKVKWKLDLPDEDVEATWPPNYSSARDHPDVIRAQYEDDIKSGRMVKHTLAEAKQIWGDRLLVAALAAIQKGGATTSEDPRDWRILFDGTNWTAL